MSEVHTKTQEVLAPYSRDTKTPMNYEAEWSFRTGRSEEGIVLGTVELVGPLHKDA